VSSFLEEMARSSAARVAEAKRQESAHALEERARLAPAAPSLCLSGRFDVIAELKLRSPAAGALGSPQQDWLARVAAYARAGAAAVSVLTEPSRFDGSLAHLQQASQVLAPLGVPAMRKDFIVDPYQIVEARAAGAGGALVILRMLPRGHISELLDAAAAHRLFVLLEAFDAADLSLAREILSARRTLGETLLQVAPQRFAELAPQLPPGWPAVAESGVATAADARSMMRLGYRLALIGTALMAHDDPSELLAEILNAARTEHS
jgi:indole-3-glycerol phosphate synthase